MDDNIMDNINELENKIGLLNDISGFKKSVTEYNKLKKELDACQLNIDNHMNKIHEISNTNCVIKLNNDDEYNNSLAEIHKITDIIDLQNIETQIVLYDKLVGLINSCDDYIQNQKIDIVYL